MDKVKIPLHNIEAWCDTLCVNMVVFFNLKVGLMLNKVYINVMKIIWHIN
jgi:hypothetical protein